MSYKCWLFWGGLTRIRDGAGRYTSIVLRQRYVFSDALMIRCAIIDGFHDLTKQRGLNTTPVAKQSYY